MSLFSFSLFCNFYCNRFVCSTTVRNIYKVSHNSKLTKLTEYNVYHAFSTSATKIPSEVDVVIIGGGIMGTSSAYWIKQRAKQPLKVLVLEKDLQYRQASTVLSVGGIRQQFSLPENIQMSQYGAEFVKNIKEQLKCDTDVHFKRHGYLNIAGESCASILEQNFATQQANGAKNELLTVKQIEERFPWLNTEGVSLGCIGLENEGWCDPWALLASIKTKATELGVNYLKSEVVDFTFKDDLTTSHRDLSGVIVKINNGDLKEINFNTCCVLAAGPNSGAVAKLAKIGTGEGLLSVALPVEPRKRFVYCFDCQTDNAPCVNSPMLIDMTDLWMRREGQSNLFIVGKSPQRDNDPKASDFEVDYEYFDREIWPTLAHRVPAFEALKVKSGWAGHYEFNTFDENGIIGQHPYYKNLFIASGFSGHGLQQGPAVGRSISELILDGKFISINLERFGFDRLITNRPMFEVNIF